MGIVRTVLKKGERPTEGQLAELKRAAALPQEYDEDCPPLTDEELKRFYRVKDMRKAEAESNRKRTVSIRLKPQTIERAKSMGKGYTSIISQIVESAFADPKKLELLIK
ncbi:MAG: BrnA antitoxin family protein [Lachnospiraceae bacterium]|nr:BrnA antitoxin family protein [Lachnospiraceae bacterium]